MRTDSYNWFICVTPVIGILLLVVTVTSGCGPTRKQYAINEALLIDQARLLEDEIYRTRYELHRTLTENQLLKEELTKSDGHSGGSHRSRESREQTPASGAIPFEPVTPPTPETAAKVNAPQKILVIPTGSTKASMVESLPATVVVPRSAVNGNSGPPLPASGTNDFPMLPMIPLVPVSRSGENGGQNSSPILPGVVPLNRPTPSNVPLGNIVPPIYQPSDSPPSTSRPMSYQEERPTITKVDSDWSPLEE